MLVVAAAAIALAVSENLWYGIHLESGRVLAGQCQAGPAEESCLSGQRDRVAWTLTVAVVICLVGVLAAVLAGRLRRRGTVPVPPAAVNHQHVVEPIVQQLKVLPPLVVWRPGRPVATARADGRGAGVVEVGPVFMASALLRPDRARAVLAHELHHLRSRDVWPARLTLWLPILLIPLIVLDLVVAIARGGSTVVPVLVRTVAAAALVIGARTAVLRARENDADLAAAAVEPAALRSWLVAIPSTSHRLARLWSAVVRPHPSIERRRQVVDHPNEALQLRTADALLVGSIAAIGAPVVTRLWRGWFGYGDPAFWAELAGWGIFGGLLGAWLVAQLVRAVVAARDDDQPVPWLRFGLVLGATLAVGALLLSPPAALIFTVPRPLPIVWLAAIVGILGTTAVISWVHWSIHWWLDRCPDDEPRGLGWVLTSGIAAVGGVLALCAAVANHAVGQALVGVPAADYGDLNNSGLSVWNQLWVLSGTWPARIVLLVAVLAPLPWVVAPRRRTAGLPAWASVPVDPVVVGVAAPADSDPPTLPVPVVPSGRAGRIRTIVVGGPVAGLAAFAALLLAKQLAPDVESWSTQLLAVFLPMLAATGTMCAVVAVLTVGTVAPPVLAGPAVAMATVVLTAAMAVTGALRGNPHGPAELVGLAWDVGGIAVGGTLLLTAWLPGSYPPRRADAARTVTVVARACAVLIPVAASAAVMMLISRPPPFAVDAQRQQNSWLATAAQAQSALGPCVNGGADAAAVASISAVEQQAADPGHQPDDPRLRDLSAEFTAVLRSCREALERAVAAGSPTIAASDLTVIEGHFQRWRTLDDQLFPR